MKIIRCIAIVSIIMMVAKSASAQDIVGMAYIRGSLAAPQTIASASFTVLNFVDLQQESGLWSAHTFYPEHNGRYTFCAGEVWDAAVTSTAWQWALYLYISDGRLYELSRKMGNGAAQNIQNAGCISMWMFSSLSAQFWTYQNTGSNRNILSAPGSTFFTIVETPLTIISQTATPQFTATPNATIPAMATIIAGLISPTVTSTMEPITETINISLAITNTTGISISRIPVSNTLHTTGFIYLPNWVGNFDPIAVMASLMIFIIVGAVMRKPTLFVISWFGLSILGVFSQSGVYWVFITIVMVAAVVIYLFFRHTQES